MRETGTRRRSARAFPAVLVAGALALFACSGDDDDAGGTLDTIAGGTTPTGSDVPGPSGATLPAGSAVDGPRGSGFVAIDVRITNAGIAETISLDRSTVAASALDPVTLDATCTPLDGGDPSAGVVVSVVDLGRLAGSQIVSAVLRYPDAAPGEHDMTLELGRADQSTASYSGTVTVGADGMSGSFFGADGGGTGVSGGFACASEATIVTTTTVALDIGEEVPEDSVAPTPPPTQPPATTVPPG